MGTEGSTKESAPCPKARTHGRLAVMRAGDSAWDPDHLATEATLGSLPVTSAPHSHVHPHVASSWGRHDAVRPRWPPVPTILS